jgi:hypothetical protein
MRSRLRFRRHLAISGSQTAKHVGKLLDTPREPSSVRDRLMILRDRAATKSVSKQVLGS